jgi:hypothetical protein
MKMDVLIEYYNKMLPVFLQSFELSTEVKDALVALAGELVQRGIFIISSASSSSSSSSSFFFVTMKM